MSAFTLLAFALASYVIVAIPGPSVLFTIGRALALGRRAAIATLLGNAAGVFLSAVLPQFVDTSGGSVSVQIAVLGLVFSLVALLSDSLYALLAGTARG